MNAGAGATHAPDPTAVARSPFATVGASLQRMLGTCVGVALAQMIDTAAR